MKKIKLFATQGQLLILSRKMKQLKIKKKKENFPHSKMFDPKKQNAVWATLDARYRVFIGQVILLIDSSHSSFNCPLFIDQDSIFTIQYLYTFT